MATFGLAVNRRWQNRQTNEWEEQTSFFDVKCWAQMAENVGESLQPGRPRDRHRPPRAALVGDRAGRQALEGRGRGRRDRPQPALGHRRGHQERAARARRQWRRLRRRSRGGRNEPARPAPAPAAAATARTRSRSDGTASRNRGKNKDNARRAKKKISILSQEQVEYVDYKDVNLLRRFMSDRAKIRARRVTGNDAQQQARSPWPSRTPARWRCCRTPTASPSSAAAATVATVATAGPAGRRPAAASRPRRRPRLARLTGRGCDVEVEAAAVGVGDVGGEEDEG